MKLDQNNAWHMRGFNLKSHICAFNLGPTTIFHTNTLDPADQHMDPYPKIFINPKIKKSASHHAPAGRVGEYKERAAQKWCQMSIW